MRNKSQKEVGEIPREGNNEETGKKGCEESEVDGMEGGRAANVEDEKRRHEEEDEAWEH